MQYLLFDEDDLNSCDNCQYKYYECEGEEFNGKVLVKKADSGEVFVCNMHSNLYRAIYHVCPTC